MDTYEIEAKRQRLAEAILAAGGADLSAALDYAAHMSIADVVEALQRQEPDLLFDHSELCDAFIRAWLDQLPPLERFAATVEVSGLYTTGMVWLPHAEDRSVERILRFAAEAVTEMGARIAGEGILAGTPDTSFGPTFALKLSALADGPVGDLRTELIARADELRELQRLDDEREAQEEGGG
ncbi:hypothetical protein [Brevibacterium luteolum]|uniref:Uncharacterized protein n=1 Tax=Brevibacterium luteolum TaxID=199591 RepID=A0A2N6PFB1_9MICO|nr:hypothetical protein [Brevibacterium luteolum]PMB97362.1 hypothetical protein CJ198_11280 [Brevibacterium luteolum]